MGVRKPKPHLPPVSKARLKGMIEEAVVDAYTEEEQAGGFLVMIREHLALPFPVNILGAGAVVEKIDMARDGRIVAICRCPRPPQQARSGSPRIMTGTRGSE